MRYMRAAAQVILAAVVIGGLQTSALTETADAAGGELETMTFNIRYGTARDGENHWTNRKQMVFDVIAERRPDVLGLQEALKFQIDEIMAAVPGYALIGVGRDDGAEKGEYSCILYRTDRLDMKDGGTFWLSDTPEVPGSITWGNACTRICSWGRFTDRRTGRDFYVYNVHLDHISQPSREKSVVLVAQRMAAREDKAPCMFMGDINAGEANPAVRFLKGELTLEGSRTPIVFKDTFRVLYPDEKVVGTFNAFKGRTEGDKIDYIFVGPGWKTLEAAIIRTNRDGLYPSDHFPLTARVLMQSE